MPVQSEMVHKAGLSFAMQRRVVMLRDVHKYPWKDIRLEVKNLEKEHPCIQTCINYYNNFRASIGRCRTFYSNCGRSSWKFTPEVEKWLVKKLLQLRKVCVCTSTTLQHALARERNIKVSASGVRKALLKKGYQWLPRSQKRRYSKEERAERSQFARGVLRLTNDALKKKLAFSMDGVILVMPPKDATERYNYCRFGESHMWRKKSESTSPELAGDDPYGKQAPLARCIPMWAGIGQGGVGIVTFHATKKLNGDDWVKVVRSKGLKNAIKDAGPINRAGPWSVLCDNEGFLSDKRAKALYEAQRISLWRIPSKSPDLNPVEKFWSWLRRVLRAMDLKDAAAKRPVLGKTAYRERVRRGLKSAKARKAATNTVNSLKKTCREVIKKKGAATRG